MCVTLGPRLLRDWLSVARRGWRGDEDDPVAGWLTKGSGRQALGALCLRAARDS